MKRKMNLWSALLMIGGLLVPIAPAVAQKSSVTAGTVTMTVTAVGKKDTQPPAITKDDVQLYRGKERVQVGEWRRGETLALAIFIDDSIDSSAGSNGEDLRSFILAQPSTTLIAVAYGRNGTAMIAQDFTNDHELAAKSLRLPLGSEGAFSSPYLSLLDLMKRWPKAGERRSVMLISSGIDYFRGDFGPRSPDLESTIERAQKQNINIWTIYYPGAGHTSRGFFRINNAQSNLSQLSEETGAESYYLGSLEPVALKPYFDEIQEHLSNQYLLTFTGRGGNKGRLERVRAVTEVSGVELLAPSEVFLPANE
ncbi:MAG: hypothetical protein PVS2B2_26570 [Candidatus Acidiferrum sp.]